MVVGSRLPTCDLKQQPKRAYNFHRHPALFLLFRKLIQVLRDALKSLISQCLAPSFVWIMPHLLHSYGRFFQTENQRMHFRTTNKNVTSLNFFLVLFEQLYFARRQQNHLKPVSEKQEGPRRPDRCFLGCLRCKHNCQSAGLMVCRTGPFRTSSSWVKRISIQKEPGTKKWGIIPIYF